MAIIIVKKGAAGLPPSARVIEDPGVKQPESTGAPAEPRSKEEAKEWWGMRMPGVKQQPALCAYCKHVYLMPCNENTHKSCGNWFELEKRRIAKEVAQAK